MVRRLLLALFFLSGAGALLFQGLWFRLAALSFGSSVWASSLVLASFMGGLAIGNGLAARRGERARRALHLYAGLELAVALTGALLVVLLPRLPGLMAPLFQALLATPALLDFTRFALAFVLLLVPAIAMGATLPILVTALVWNGGGYGRALGLLYGFNTLGAVAGALAGELALVERIGLTGTGFVAALLDLLAAFGAFALARSFPEEADSRPNTAFPQAALTARLLLATALCGGILLALEVVWFRFLQLFVAGTSLAFALMLAVVLSGIALGGLVAAAWLPHGPRTTRGSPSSPWAREPSPSLPTPPSTT